jgi:tRNA A37 threonylcarbamoyladenosine biosynthesis protein TsaE
MLFSASIGLVLSALMLALPLISYKTRNVCMSFFAYRAEPFQYTHENLFFNKLYDLFDAHFQHQKTTLYLLGNLSVAGQQIDALIIKANAIAVIDFKDYGGQIEWFENSTWRAEKTRILAGRFENPYKQIQHYKHALMNFLKQNVVFEHQPDLSHISGVCLFHQPIVHHKKPFQPTISRWFFVCDIEGFLDCIDSLASPKFRFNDEDQLALVRSFGIKPYFPSAQHRLQAQNQAQLQQVSKPLDIPARFAQRGLTQDQEQAITQVQDFLMSPNSEVFILKGYAGTGKTFLAKGIIDAYQQHGKYCVLLAPTGKAAQVLARKTQISAETIHRHLYNYSDTTEHEQHIKQATLKINSDPKDTLYLIDEASMISNIASDDGNIKFGSGYLLDDLIAYIRSGFHAKRKIIFMGDSAQLPPVNMECSPALSADYLRQNYQMAVAMTELSTVVRQNHDSGVIDNATMLRHALKENIFNQLFFKTDKPDTVSVTEENIIEYYMRLCNQQLGQTKDMMLIAATNKKVAFYNKACRAYFFPNHNELRPKDKVIVVANHYGEDLSVMNGQFGQIKAVSPVSESRSVVFSKKEDGKTVNISVTLTFRDVEVLFVNHQGERIIIQCKIHEELLYNDQASLSEDERSALYADFLQRNPKLKRKGHEEDRKLVQKKDPYLNALQLKFGYAMTCHKAQGSEWSKVLVDCDRQQSKLCENYFRWLYTATTRTKDTLYVLREPKIKLGSGAEIVGTFLFQTTKPTQDECQPANHCILENLAQRIQTLLANQAIQINKLKSSSYQERYQFQAHNEFVEVNFYYNGKNKVTKIQCAQTGTFATKLQQLLFPLQGQVLTANTQILGNPRFNEQHLKDFHQRLAEVYSDHQIKIADLHQFEFKQRYTLAKDQHTAVIDFYYNKKKQFKKVLPQLNQSSCKHFLEDVVQIWNQN